MEKTQEELLKSIACEIHQILVEDGGEHLVMGVRFSPSLERSFIATAHEFRKTLNRQRHTIRTTSNGRQHINGTYNMQHCGWVDSRTDGPLPWYGGQAREPLPFLKCRISSYKHLPEL